jgi:Mg2+ and Co2+ transporter CorA
MQKLFEGQAAGTSRADVMAREIEEITEKRNQYSRKRIEDDSKDVTSINERNKAYNKKLERNFSKYANEIKGSLERGTAM